MQCPSAHLVFKEGFKMLNKMGRIKFNSPDLIIFSDGKLHEGIPAPAIEDQNKKDLSDSSEREA